MVYMIIYAIDAASGRFPVPLHDGATRPEGGTLGVNEIFLRLESVDRGAGEKARIAKMS